MDGLRQHRGSGGEGEVADGLVVVGLGAQPRLPRDGVPLGGLGVLPRLVGVDLGDHRVELGRDLGDHALGVGRDGEHLAREAVRRAVRADVDGVAVAVALVGLEPELGDRLDESVLVGRDPLAADLEHRAVDHVGPQPSADAVARLEHGDRQSGLAQLVRRGQPGGAGADDDDVPRDLGHFHSFVTTVLHLVSKPPLSRRDHPPLARAEPGGFGEKGWSGRSARPRPALRRRRPGPRGAGRRGSRAAEGSGSRSRRCRR